MKAKPALPERVRSMEGLGLGGETPLRLQWHKLAAQRRAPVLSLACGAERMTMKHEVKLTDAIGKTLEGVAFSSTCGQAVLVFTDGNFSTLGVFRGHDEGDEEIKEDSLKLLEFGDDKLFRVGVTTDDELTRIRVERNAVSRANYQRQQDARDKVEFERLKKKFEA